MPQTILTTFPRILVYIVGGILVQAYQTEGYCNGGFGCQQYGVGTPYQWSCSPSSGQCCQQLTCHYGPWWQCACYVGYTLHPDYRSCIDIDECAFGLHTCQHLCINLNGSYTCACNPGYRLGPDKCKCIPDGPVTGTPPTPPIDTTPLPTPPGPTTVPVCVGDFEIPVGCQALGNCEYIAKWRVSGDGDTSVISFEITARTNGWVGIGFSEDAFMPNSDIVVGWVNSQGGVVVTDRYATERKEPAVDEDHDLFGISGSKSNGFTTIRFSRNLVTDDDEEEEEDDDEAREDIQFKPNTCHYFLFAYGPDFNDETLSITYHGGNRFVSTEKICIGGSSDCSAIIETPVCPRNEGTVRHPIYCDKFMTCAWDQAIHIQTCPDGHHYSSTGKCLPASQVNCSYEPGAIRNYTVPPTCVKVTDWDNCAGYLVKCWEVDKPDTLSYIPYTCPQSMLWDNETMKCMEAKDVECGNRTVHPGPLCPEHKGNYEEPVNCRMFLTCEYYRLHRFRMCPNGLMYSHEHNRCDWAFLVDCKGRPTPPAPSPTQPPLDRTFPPSPPPTLPPTLPPTIRIFPTLAPYPATQAPPKPTKTRPDEIDRDRPNVYYNIDGPHKK